MATSSVLTAILSIIVLYFLNYYRCLVRNLAAARRSGIPYVVLPWNPYHIFWLVTHPLWLPLLEKLPASRTKSWISFMNPEWAYLLGYKPFAELGSDFFLTVSSGRITFFVADAEAITQITSRRNDFPKPLEMYKSLDIYGKNVVSTEGSTWRTHRKLTAPSFTEKNNELVFTESLHHAQALVRLWAGPGGEGNQTIKEPAADTMRFALYIISRAGFDIRVLWPHEEADASETEAQDAFSSTKPPKGHDMSYRDALNVLLENIVWTQIFPPWMLKHSPVKVHNATYTAMNEWGKYMGELYHTKETQLSTGHSAHQGMDLFGALIHGVSQTGALQQSDIMGNAFVIMLAGHETTANALHYSLIYLALNLSSQRHLQQDLDDILQGAPISSWKYDELFPKLFAAMPAAVMNETLRTLQPIINIPKSTTNPQPLTISGTRYLVPAGAQINLCCAVHKNPRYWPSVSSTSTASDADKWIPERWLKTNTSSPTTAPGETDYDDEELRGPSGADTSSHLFHPVRGSYIPFSEGYRSCMGRRFSQVELLAVLAMVFREWSVELAVDEFASDEEVDAMAVDGEQRRAVWEKARGKAERILAGSLTSVITLQMRGKHVPLRLVRRGRERFGFV